MWRKRGSLGTAQNWFGASTNHSIGFNAGDQIQLTINGTTYTSTAVYRDPGAWYHLHYTQSGTTYTVSVNGTVVLTGTSVANVSFNTAISHQLGAANTTNYSDGLFADVCFVDGTAVAVTSFGRTGSGTGEWVHKNPAGITYGTNGFRLQFNSISVVADFGTDTSGNGNTWTVTNLSATTGVTMDSLTDTPTKNYCTLNPVNPTAQPLSYANLRSVLSTTENGIASTMPVTDGLKVYAEQSHTTTTSAGVGTYLGVAGVNVAFNTAALYGIVNTWTAVCTSAKNRYNSGSASGSAAGTVANTSTLQIAIDATGASNVLVWFGVDNTWYDSSMGTTGNPATGANPTWTISKQDLYINCFGYQNTIDVNFGQRAFAFTPPTGFLGHNTANLSATGTVTVSGSFTGNGAADGPVVAMNGFPTTLTINSNAVTFGTHADALATGFKLRTASASYNVAGANTWTATIVSNIKNLFKYSTAR